VRGVAVTVGDTGKTVLLYDPHVLTEGVPAAAAAVAAAVVVSKINSGHHEDTERERQRETVGARQR